MRAVRGRLRCAVRPPLLTHARAVVVRRLALCFLIVLAIPRAVFAQADEYAAPAERSGRFVDDYGTEYEITDTLWSHGRNARYRIVEWSPSGMYLLARHHADNPSEAGRWTRIDWV